MPPRRSLNDLAPLAATGARLKRVERALARWDAYDTGQERDLHAMLVQVMVA